MPLPMAKDCCCDGPCYTYYENFARPGNNIELLEPDWEVCGSWSAWSLVSGSGLVSNTAGTPLVLKHMVGNPYGILTGKWEIAEGHIYLVHVFYGTQQNACSGSPSYTVKFEAITDNDMRVGIYKFGSTEPEDERVFFSPTSEVEWNVCVGPNAINAGIQSSVEDVRACGTPTNYWFAIEADSDTTIWTELRYIDHYAHNRQCPECAGSCCFPDWTNTIKGFYVTMFDIGQGSCNPPDGCAETVSFYVKLAEDASRCSCVLKFSIDPDADPPSSLIDGPHNCFVGKTLVDVALTCTSTGIVWAMSFIPDDGGQAESQWDKTFPVGTAPENIKETDGMTWQSNGDNGSCDYDGALVTFTPDVVAGCCSEEEPLSIQTSDISQSRLNKFHSLWESLHSYAPNNRDNWSFTKAQKFYNEWRTGIPSGKCGCKNHWTELVAFNPPNYDSPEKFFEWTWARHDDVSRLHSNAPRITLEEAYALYWT